MTADPVLSALGALLDAGLVSDRAVLNDAWAELTGRAPLTSGVRCQARGCDQLGRSFIEPAGTWCATHLPALWKAPTGSRWACPRCWRCAAPAAYPNRPGTFTRPICRAHAPSWLRRYLAPDAASLEEVPA